MSKKYIYISFIFICLLTSLTYIKALSGPLVYDDLSNLSVLEIFQNDELSWYEKTKYTVTTNSSGPLGRPVSMLSFTMFADNWPNTFHIKLINLILHSITGFLVLLVARELFNRFNVRDQQVGLLSLAVSGVWLIHPINVGTVLYAIQRMEILSGMFGLAALLVFLRYIDQPDVSKKKFIAFSILCGVLLTLGTLSKEDSSLFLFLIPLIIHCTESTRPSWYKKYALVFFYFPSLLLLIALSYTIYINSDIQQGHIIRDLTPFNRVLTQPLVLLDYLKQIIAPNYHTMSLFHDDFLSLGFLEIKKTLSIILVSLIIIYSILTKHKIITVTVLWFFIIHFMEASTIPIYLYFEHRNYAASVGPLILLVYILSSVISKLKNSGSIKSSVTTIFRYAFLGIFLIFCIQTHLLTKRWAAEENLYISWLEAHPNSELTLFSLLNYYQRNNHLQLSINLTEVALQYPFYQSNLSLVLYNYLGTCVSGSPNNQLLNDTTNNIDKFQINNNFRYILRSIIEYTQNEKCKPNFKDLIKIAEKALDAKVSDNIKYRDNILSALGHLNTLNGDHQRAIYYFTQTDPKINTDNLSALIHMYILTERFSAAEESISMALKMVQSNIKSKEKLNSDIMLLQQMLDEQRDNSYSN